MNLLEHDKRWLKFVDRYCADLPRFAIEVVDLNLSAQQLKFLEEAQASRARVSVSSGHGCFCFSFEQKTASWETARRFFCGC